MAERKVAESTSGPAGRLRSLLILGGARSGKSRYAQDLAEGSGRELVFIATARAQDAEMRDRIERHRSERGVRWRTVEEPLRLAEVLAREAGPGRLVLVDCLTLWLSNTMLAGGETGSAAAELAAATGALGGPAVFVSNEVGSGIVPATALGRAFRDAQGRLNQDMARACAGVVQVTAGLPRLLKPTPTPEIGFRAPEDWALVATATRSSGAS